jgi:hypothetical protein
LPGGGIRFAADHGKDGHSDRFWALALAKRAALSPEVVGEFRRVNSGAAGRANAALESRRDRGLIG